LKQALLPERIYNWDDVENVRIRRRPLISLVVWSLTKRANASVGSKMDRYLPWGWSEPQEIILSAKDASQKTTGKAE
jgi:hypothetical protein